MTATIVNGMRESLAEEIPSYDNAFIIKGRGDDPFAITHIPDTDYIMDLGEPVGTQRFKEDGCVIAKAICESFTKSLYGYKENCQPLLFYVEGQHKKEEIPQLFKKELEEAAKMHRNYLKSLVDLADIDYKRYDSALFISDAQKQACMELGLEREWTNLDFAAELCPACKRAVLSDQVVCNHCNCILDMNRFKQLSFVGRPEQ